MSVMIETTSTPRWGIAHSLRLADRAGRLGHELQVFACRLEREERLTE